MPQLGTGELTDMTKNESFKRRVRARMEKTGERYTAARRQMLDKAAQHSGRQWISQPEMSDEVVFDATGRRWDEWCKVIEESSFVGQGHSAIAGHLEEEYGIGGWWAQAVTVGYERIVGIRLPYQMPDGTFTANKSRTVEVDGDVLRKNLLESEHRSDMFPGQETTLRSKPESKVVRLGIGLGVALISIDPKPDGRSKVTVAHEGLPTYEDVAEWKFFWTEWLNALDG
ncbi:MAG: hypothetical protein HKN91_09415 [Acidimicrobiia bacterium]|nr:hypothetical protein [Acidimicrobiia bacterium]